MNSFYFKQNNFDGYYLIVLMLNFLICKTWYILWSKEYNFQAFLINYMDLYLSNISVLILQTEKTCGVIRWRCDVDEEEEGTITIKYNVLSMVFFDT